jgi:hypothetical protein
MPLTPQTTNQKYKRGPARACLDPAYRNHHRKDTKRGEAPSCDAEPGGNHRQEEGNSHADAL